MVEILKKEQAASEVAIEQLAGGGRIRSKQRKVVRHELSVSTWEPEEDRSTINYALKTCERCHNWAHLSGLKGQQRHDKVIFTKGPGS